MVGLVVCLLTVDVPPEVFVDLLLFLLLEGVSVKVKLVLAHSFCLQFLLCFGALLPVLLLLQHFGVIYVILSVFLLECSLAVGHLCLVDLQLQLKVLIHRLFFEFSFEVLSNFSIVLGLLRDNRLFLTLLFLLLFILQLTFSLVQISQVPLTDL